MFVFIFVFFGLFSAIVVAIPTQFVQLGVTTTVQDKEAATFFAANNVTVYNYTVAVNITYPGSVIKEGTDFGLPADQAVEFWWQSEHPYYEIVYLEIRHLTRSWWWWDYHRLAVASPYDVMLQAASNPDIGLRRWDVLDLFDEEANASYCEFTCTHMDVKLFILTYNQSWTLEESWDNGKLKLYVSYNIDWTRTSYSMWHILMQLLSFQTPNLGVSGFFGSVIGWVISGTLWACIAVIVYAALTAILPLVPGWRGG